ncbi:hypothetical protein EDC94DRAFT_597850 [Helicostylum pulchrum]|nr:hypothetical protein EDC94DRAFT_597850 [Helicostylum pulchrum]
MDPSVCTVVILHQPFIINENDTYQQLLQSYFGQVYIQQDRVEAIEKVKESSSQEPTLLLLDLDAIQYTQDNTESLNYSCSTCPTIDNTRHVSGLISKITRDLNTLPNYVPLVVCSSNDNTEIMLDCIHAGATDYILKPIPINVIKTLFLKLHSCQPTSRIKQQKKLVSDCNNLKERITEMTNKDIHFSKLLMDVYASPTATLKYPNISKKRSSELKTRVCSWDFSPFGLTEQDLIHSVYLIFDQVLKLPELYHISITQAQLYDFIIDLAGVYHNQNPYHNFAHAVDVLQCLFYMLCELGVLPFTNKFLQKSKPQSLLRPKDVFALLIAAIGHDAAHPGVNNSFLINSSNPLATLYNDKSVLESLHAMTLFQLLNKHGIDRLVGDLKSEAYKDFRKTVVSTILATDMSLHNDYVSKIKEQANRFNTNSHLDEQEERNLLCSALIKCADISNVARPFHWGTKWAELLVQEFISQGDLEKQMGLPVLPMNDRTKVVLEDSQINFIKFVALDLFQNVAHVLNEIEFAADQMKKNLRRWESRKKSIEYEQEEFDIVSNSSTTHMIMVETGVKRSSSSLDLQHNDVKRRPSIEKYPVNNTDDRDAPVYCQCSIQ